MSQKLDLAGQRYGRLSVLNRVKVPGTRNAMWRCRCDCGKETIAAAANIGRSTWSCGCLAKESARNLLLGNTYTQTHKMSNAPEYKAWARMKLRCNDPEHPKYPIYGARGITVCDRWLNSFENFNADMGPRPSPRHSIDRRNNNGNYEPSNCRWATKGQQSRNMRKNRWITIEGRTECIADWCDLLAVSRQKPYDMCRAGGRKKNLPSKFRSLEDAVRAIYASKFVAV